MLHAVSVGSPAVSHAVRVTFMAWAPIWSTQPAHHLANSGGIDARALNHSRLHLAEQRSGMDRGQTAVSLAHWGANGLDDDDVSHGPTIEPLAIVQPVEACCYR